MKSLITRAVFRNNILKLVIFIAIFIIWGCASTPTPPPTPELTQLEVRQLQTREYKSTPTIVMKAVIAALQDEGFIISSSNPELGLVTAAMEKYEVDTATKSRAEFWQGAGSGTYQTTKRWEASASINKHGEVVRVRINIVAKALTNTGGLVWSQPVYEADIYQTIFSKVDKAVFLEKEKI
jgi:hypothetical protein